MKVIFCIGGFVFLALFIFAKHHTDAGQAASFIVSVLCFGFASILDKLDNMP